MVDWTKPIEYTDGSEARLLRAKDGGDGDFVVTPHGQPHRKDGNYYYWDGSPVRCSGTRLHIRNRAEPARYELAELRAFKEAAIARFPELAPVEVDPDVLQARKIALKFALPAQFSGMTSHRTNQGEFDDSDVMAAIGEAMDWARANPR